MGFNITEIGQKVLNITTNAANIFRKMYDLHYNPKPLDVELPYIDENGNLLIAKQMNNAKFRKRVWDDVGGALGQFNRTFYVDVVNGDDNNTGTSDSPFKTIKKAVDSVPVGGNGIIILLNDYDLSNEASNIYIKGKKILIRLNGYTLTKSDSRCFVVTDFFGYIKIYAGNGTTSTINITDNTSGLIRFVDTIGTCILGDYDSVLNINVKGKIVESLRSQIKGYAIRCNFTGLSDDTYIDTVITRDANQVDFHTHTSCTFTNMRLTNGVRDPYILRDENDPLIAVTLYVDPTNGSDKNPGHLPDQALRTLEAAIKKAPRFLTTYIKLMGDYTLNSYVSMNDKLIYINSYDNNVNNASKLTIKIIDLGDGNYRTPIGADRFCMLQIRTHVTFDGNGTNGPACIWIPHGVLKLTSGLVDDNGALTQMNVDLTAPVKIGAALTTQWYKCNFNVSDDCILYAVPYTGILKIAADNTINGDVITASNLKDYVVGVNYDADSGTPVNLTCNLNLSN